MLVGTPNDRQVARAMMKHVWKSFTTFQFETRMCVQLFLSIGVIVAACAHIIPV